VSEPSWTEGVVKREAARDVMSMGQRLGEAVAIAFSLIVLLFFVANQVQDTGFFTSSFGAAEMVLFYGSLLFGMAAPMLRLFLGRRNKVRPVELISTGFFIVATSYLLYVFPFDFSHLADLLPGSIQFLLDWITNDIAEALFGLAIVVATFASVWMAFLYVMVRDWLIRNPPSPKPQ